MAVINFYGLGQNISIRGKVTGENNKPLQHAAIHILNTSLTTESHNDGSFVIPGLQKGTNTLSVSLVNYASIQINFDIASADTVINIQLQSDIQQLDDVTVTAEKRETGLQQLPVSISALTAKQIANYRLWNISQLTAVIPDLYSDNPGDGRNITSIRGIVTTSYDPAVATYIDGVNQFSLDTYIGTLSDVERIEVLRGPQGTLYGRNAMGGVVNIITKQPENKTEGFAEINVGNYNLQRYNAGIRTALIKNKLFAGASLLYTKRDGYYDNDFTNTSFDKQHSLYGNYYLTYLPGKQWTITANAKHEENRNNGAFPLVNGVDESFANPFHLSQDATAKMIDNLFNGSLVVNHAGGKINLSSVSSYQSNSRTYNAPLDGDFSPADVVSIINDYGKKYNNVKVFTQEIRAVSADETKKLQYTTGAYFFYQNNPVKQGTFYGAFANAAYNIGDSLFTIVNTSKSVGTGIALYGQIQYALAAKLKLTAGIRYDYEHRKLSVESEYQKESFGFVTLPDTSAKTSFHAVSPKVSFQYLVSKNNNVYATYTRGYRVGGLSPVPADPSGPVALSSYRPENSDNYEAGSKNVFFDHKLKINIAAFVTFINNAQVPTLVLPDAITIIKNTGKLQTRGLEADISATPLKGLRLDYNAGIIHTEYKSLKVSQGGTEVNLKGKKQIYTPSATSLLAAQYSLFIARQTRLSIRGEWQYKGNMYFDFANAIEQKSYALFHARAGADFKTFGLYVWIKNITDKKFIAYAYDFGAVHLGNPRTTGITLNLKF